MWHRFINLFPLLIFVLYLRTNLAEYRKAKSWITSHKIDVSFYEKDKLKKKESSVLGFIVYYAGYLGRKLAYRSYRSCEKD